MTPTDARDAYERLGLVADADEPGVYALKVAVPDAVDRVARAWLAEHDVPLPDAYEVQLAAADEVLYVGGTSRPIRERVAEHARGEVRTASLLDAFDAVDVVGVWPGDSGPLAERNRARALSDGATVCWCDGEMF